MINKIQNKSIIFLLLPIISFICPAYIKAQNINQQLQNIFENEQLMGMSVIGFCNNGIQQINHFGLSDYQRGIPIDDSTCYRIASISKTITAVAMLQLHEQGYFKLDDSIDAYLGFQLRNPYFPYVPITFRMLLSHTSSLKDGAAYSPFLSATYNNTPPPCLSQLLMDTGSYYATNLFLNKQPGTYFEYANINYGIIGTLIESISGQRFDKYCRNNIFEPLNIFGSFNINDLPDINKVAVLYRKYNNIWTPQIDNYQGVMPPERDLSTYVPGSNGFIFAPQGGLRISALDLYKIMHALMNNGMHDTINLLQSATVQEMLTPQWIYNGSNGNNYYCLFNSWGLGTHLTTNNNNCDIVFQTSTMAGHPGEAYGLISDVYFNTQQKNGIIFITSGCANPYQVGNTSAFYTVEEQIFQAIEQHITSYCTVQSKNFNFKNINIFYDYQNNKLNIELNKPISQCGTITIFNLTGNIIHQNTLATNTVTQTYQIGFLHQKNQLLIIKLAAPEINLTTKILIP